MALESVTPPYSKTRYWIEYLVTFAFFFFITGWLGKIVPSILSLFLVGLLFWPMLDLVFPWRRSKFELGPDYLGFKYGYLPLLMAIIFALLAGGLVFKGLGQSARVFQLSAVAGLFSWFSFQQLSIWFRLQKMSASHE